MEEKPTRCLPCEGKVLPLSKEKIKKLLPQVAGWEWVDEKKLVKEFAFEDFIEAKYFLDLLAQIAESQGHHPTFSLIYNKLKVSLTTHAASGLTENDFIMARIIDEVE
jgi:pterin-4a-carbinolamine dehydratase